MVHRLHDKLFHGTIAKVRRRYEGNIMLNMKWK